MTETYFSVDFKQNLSGFEKNQQVILERRDNLLSCQSGQVQSTPGVIRKDIRLPKSAFYCLEVTGWSNCPRAFVQIIDTQTGQRLISGYRYLDQSEDGLLRVNFRLNTKAKHKKINSHGELSQSDKKINSHRELSQSDKKINSHGELSQSDKKINLAFFFGGSGTPTLKDRFWLRQIKITNRDLSDEPDAPHRQEVIIKRPFDDQKKQIFLKNPLQLVPVNAPVFHDRKSAKKALVDDSSRLIHLTGTFYLYLDPDGYVRYVENS